MFLIPWFAFCTLWAVLYRYGWGLRVSFLAAQVINGVLIVFVTEALSVFLALTFWPLAAFWSLVLLVNVILLYRLRQRPLAVFQPLRFDAIEIAILIAVGFIVAVTGLIAIIAPPNNNDSMVYHMARVAHWAYNGTVANYPTKVLRQLIMPVYSEYAILQGYILSRSDYLANLVQWGSMIGSLAGVSLIAGLLGGSRLVQLCSVLFAATLPMGILQASSTQTDYVAALWAVCVTAFALQFMHTAFRRWGVLSVLSLGLASLAKGIAVTLGAPFLIWALWRVRWKLADKICLAALAIGIVAAMNVAYVVRVSQLSPEPLKFIAKLGGAMVHSVDPRGMLSDVVRGAAVELAAPFEGWNEMLVKLVEFVHGGLGIKINDARFTFPPGDDFAFLYAPCREDYATGLIHSIVYLLVGLAGLGLMASRLLFRPLKRSGDVSVGTPGRGNVTGTSTPKIAWPSFVAVFLGAVLIFCWTVKWQPWIARFHLQFFVLFSAVAAVAVTHILGRTWPALLLGGIMFVTSLSPLLYGQQRPLLPGWGLSKRVLQKNFRRGGEIYRWLVRNGYVEESVLGEQGYFTGQTDDLRDRLRMVFSEEFEPLWFELIHIRSFPGGILFTPREELIFARFGKIVRTEMVKNIGYMRKRLSMEPGCVDVGYFRGTIQYEYPLWSLLKTDGRVMRIEHVMNGNESKDIPYPKGEPDPCMIVIEGRKGEAMIEYRGRIYRRETTGPYQVYMDSGVAVPGESVGSLQALPGWDNEISGNSVLRPEK